MFKKLALIAAMIIIGGMHPTTADAHDDSMMVAHETTVNKIAYANIRLQDGRVVGSYGMGIKLPITLPVVGDLWSFSSLDFEQEGQAANVNFAVLANVEDVFNTIPYLRDMPVLKQLFNKTIFHKVRMGPLFGPDFDIQNPPGGDAITYARLGIGFIAVYDVFESAGLNLSVKRELSMDNESAAGNDYHIGGGAYIAF